MTTFPLYIFLTRQATAYWFFTLIKYLIPVIAELISGYRERPWL